MEAGATMLAPVTTRFAQIQPDRFRKELEQLSHAESEWKELVASQVEQATLSPVQAAGIISAVTGQLFGYSEFHRQLTPADLILLGEQDNGGR